ncbi:MAG: radical SAM protein [Candidatus Hydrogenedentota bacterium]
MKNDLRVIFLETTNLCNLNCIHCRRINKNNNQQLNFKEIKRLIDDISLQYSPLFVLSGGEPLMRKDIFEIIEYSATTGLATALASNGTLIDQQIANKIKVSKLKRVSISLDGSNEEIHNYLRNEKDSYKKAISGIRSLIKEGVEVQVNCTVSRHNKDDLTNLFELCIKERVIALHFFLFVPVSCGLELKEKDQLNKYEYESILEQIYILDKQNKIEIRATCAPQYYRLLVQQGEPIKKVTKGCLAGYSVCFIASDGNVYPCGYLPISAGNIRKSSFSEIWENGEIFKILRDENNLKGKCGICEFKYICSGCRARAYSLYGDFLAEEPLCLYNPSVRGDIIEAKSKIMKPYRKVWNYNF